MVKGVNRAAQLWQNWAELQKMLEDVLGKNLNSGVLKRQEYDFLKDGLHRLSVEPKPKERLLISFLQKHTRQLEKELYPNRLLRVLVRLKAMLFDRPLIIARRRKLAEKNRLELADNLKHLGFSGPALDLRELLDFERAKVSVELSTQLSDNKAYETVLHLEKDHLGMYQLSGFEATLKDAVEAEPARAYHFNASHGITAKEALNLLQGRAVFKGEQWLQFDFSAQYPNGQYALKRFDKDYGYDLKKELSILGVHLNQPGLSHAKLVKALEEGKQVSLTFDHKPYAVEADPARRTVTVRNQTEKIVPLEILTKKLRQQRKQPEQSQLRSNTLKKGNTQEQSLMIG